MWVLVLDEVELAIPLAFLFELVAVWFVTNCVTKLLVVLAVVPQSVPFQDDPEVPLNVLVLVLEQVNRQRRRLYQPLRNLLDRIHVMLQVVNKQFLARLKLPQAEHSDCRYGLILVPVCQVLNGQVLQVVAWKESLGDDHLLEADVGCSAGRWMIHQLAKGVRVEIASIELMLARPAVDLGEVKNAVGREM